MFLGKNNKLEALVGPHSEFRGDIIAKGTFRIDGTFQGNITADTVVLGENASLKGDVSARCVVIGGKIEGSIKADELVEVRHTGQVRGDISTRKLSVAEGGVFDGRSIIQKEEGKIIDFPTVETTAK
ncbi:MAG: polymer-forming cytoskeletal protein [Thermodesulfovibrionales bacterium]